MKSTIKLFKGVLITQKRKKKPTKELLDKIIKKGFLFASEVIYNYSEEELNKLIEIVEKEVGLTAEQMNNSFHKSWIKVKTASMQQLVMEQLIHYLTTYGFEELGIYDKDSVYIPKEKLKIPELDVESFNFVLIKGYTKEELKEKLMKLLTSGIALKEDTMNAAVDVAKLTEINEEEIESVKNKEVKIILYDKLNKIPNIPTEFLRFCIYKSTGKTLLIKDKQTIKEIKDKNELSEQAIKDLKDNGESVEIEIYNDTKTSEVLELFVNYKKKYGLEKLAQIFYRFKPIFLAFRKNDQLKHIVNDIRRKAKKHHKPMPKDYLNDIT